MARTKKTTEVITEKTTDEVGFAELELKIQKPTLNADKTLSIGGNFAELGVKIQSIVDRYKGVQLTEDNVSYVKTLKGQFASLRTGIERERKEYQKVYIMPAKRLIDSMCDELQKIVAEGENALGVQLDAYDQKRKDELTIILNEYKEDSAQRHNLRDEYKEQIQLIDKYYNKTQNEEDSADDIERQAVELEKKQKEYDAGVALITAECQDAGFLPDSYIRELQYKSATEIILDIKQDKKTKKAMTDIKDPYINDEPVNESVNESVNEETRTRVMRIVYKHENAKKIATAMKELCISYEFIDANF